MFYILPLVLVDEIIKIQDMKQEPIPVKIVIVGDNSIKKVSLFLSYIHKDIENTPTVFDNYALNTVIDNKKVNLQLWDTAGAEQYNRLRPLAYPNCDLMIIAFSVVQRSSFVNAYKKWYPQIKQNIQNLLAVFVGLHTQLRKEYKSKNKGAQVVQKNEANLLISGQLKCKYFECNPSTRQNVQDVMNECAKMALNRKLNPFVRKQKQNKCNII